MVQVVAEAEAGPGSASAPPVAPPVVPRIVGCVDGCRPRSWTRRGRYPSKNMKRKSPFERRRRNRRERCEGGWEPSCSSQDDPTRAPMALAVTRTARIFVVDARRDCDHAGDDGDEATTSP